ncbi:odorant receptor 46a-like [Plutella xylostella]|uniref:odorant receptor 46a-like n=1 Tax=Plutella xylostella TaxID=51655 RepID=UPI0020330906|nr:odorant receptor 46a-like [Plutella xylostella]
MIKWILNYLHDPRYPSLCIILNYFKFFIIWEPSHTPRQRIVYRTILTCYMITHIGHFIYLPISGQPFYYFMILLKQGVFQMAVFKLFNIMRHIADWRRLMDRMSQLETEQLRDPHLQPIVTRYIKHGQKCIMAYWAMSIAITNWIYGRNVYSTVKRMETYGELDPDDVGYFWLWPTGLYSGRWKVYSYVVWQLFYGICSNIYVNGWDGLCVAMMILLAGQVEVLCEMFKRALDTDDEEEQKKNLVNCYKRYVELLKAHNLCNSMMSPVLFVYLLFASINLALILYSVDSLETSGVFLAATLFGGLMVQLFFYYWHGHQIIYQSSVVSASVYASGWVAASARVRRRVFLMSATTDRRLVFHAGPFNEVSLTTFVAIVKTSYSFYKLMSST